MRYRNGTDTRAIERIRNFIVRHQLIVFFPLAYAITWTIWIPSLLTDYAGVISAWGAYGPALAGIFITRLVSPQRSGESRKVSRLAFLLGMIFSAFVYFLVAWMNLRPPWSSKIVTIVVFQGLISSIAPAYVLSSIFSRNEAVRLYLKSLIKPGGSVLYYLFALLIIPFTSWLGSLLSEALSQTALYETPALDGWDGVALLAIAFITQFFYGNALGEEVGWRGFALPRLQARSSPLIASLALALFWFAWHLPLKVLNPDALPYLFYGLCFIPQTILLTWLFNRTKGSILAVGLAHVTYNVVGKYIFAASHAWLIVQFVLAIVLVVVDRMWVKQSLGRNSSMTQKASAISKPMQ